jgi:hypothetical protein
VVEGGGASLAVGGDTAGRHRVDDKRGWWDGVGMAPEDDGQDWWGRHGDGARGWRGEGRPSEESEARGGRCGLTLALTRDR